MLAIAKQTLAGAAEDRIAEIFEGRILALSKAQALLGRTSWDRVGLRHVIDRILEPFGLHDPRKERFRAVGGDVRLQPKAALSLAMVFHELATNAAKHGALSTDAGQVSDTWHVYRAFPMLQKPYERAYLVTALESLAASHEGKLGG